MSASKTQLRVVFYAQHLSGVGHYVRSLEIAKAVCRKHAAWMFDGGRPVPRPDVGQVVMLPLPRIQRLGGKLLPTESQNTIEQTMSMRRDALADSIGRIKPHAVVIEHYPFSKWELGDEVQWLLRRAREASPQVKAICSLRDIPLQTRNEPCTTQAYAEEVLKRLHEDFDGLMVHTDPALAVLDQYFAGAKLIRIPVEHTGIVAEALRAATPDQNEAKWIIASAGGGDDTGGLLECVASAWRLLKQAGELHGYRLKIFAGLDGSQHSADQPEGIDGITWQPFGTDYLESMQFCELSISCAGYNTCANILSTRCRAVLAPNPAMSDQVARGRIMHGLGYGAFTESRPTPDTMAIAILRSLERPAPHPSVDLQGGLRSADFIISLAG